MLQTTVKGGTNAGIRKPYSGGHAPTCCCSKCEKERDERHGTQR